jgi:hypothetical protein
LQWLVLLEPPIFFSLREKRKRAVHGPKEKSVCELDGKLWLGGTLTRSPNRLASALNPAAAAAAGGIDGPFSVQFTIIHLLGRFLFCQQYSCSPAKLAGEFLDFYI